MKVQYSHNIIFMDFVYGKKIVDCSNSSFKSYFKNPKEVTPYDLFYVAKSIADDMTCSDGIKFMELCIVIAAVSLKPD